ncbi:MAG: dienelactone hydrolase family protein [Bacteroidia bacterium]|nr:dienelactone hydrolase family protein [Bacteroidia bacterium]
MKKALLFLFLLPLSGFAQQPSCCEPVASADPNAVFASFGSSSEFRGMHETPAPFVLEEPAGKMITFATEGGKEGSAYFLPSANPSKKWLFVFHEWWGLNDYVRRESERWQEKLGDVNVIALDLYDGQVATTREEASQFMQACTKERAEAIIAGARKFAGKKAKIYTIGWCFGGGWSMQASLLVGKQGAGCVMYYGMPETDATRLKQLKADVLMVWPTQDKWINEDVVNNFKSNMNEAKKSLEVKAYDADHAFANPTGQRYNEAAAQEANGEALKFFQARMK